MFTKLNVNITFAISMLYIYENVEAVIIIIIIMDDDGDDVCLQFFNIQKQTT